MRRSLFLWPVFVVLSALSAFADARLSVLVDVLKLPQAARILSDEGRAHAQDLNADMLGGQGGPGWAMQVERIYEPERMVEMVRAELGRELSDAAMEQVITFFASDLGVEIIQLENSARLAIQDPDVEAAARGHFAALEGRDDPRFAQVDRYIAGGDMVERNVASAMNSNFQFMRGLKDGGAIKLSEEEILRDVGSEIEEITMDTQSWLFGYMLMAYSPLEDAELETYITFAMTPAGQALNRALFTGFGKAYEDISYALGRAVALNMTAQDL